MAKAKTIYHSALVQLGPVEVTVKSDIMKSKFGNKAEYVVLEIEGEDRNYSFDTPECKTPFVNQKGQTFTIVAEGDGRDGTAVVTYVGEGGGTPQRKPAPQQPQRPTPPQRPAQAQQQRPAQQAQPPARPPQPQHKEPNGWRIGAAINKAMDFHIASGAAWDPTAVWEMASDIIRISERLELNKLALPFSERQKAQQQ